MRTIRFIPFGWLVIRLSTGKGFFSIRVFRRAYLDRLAAKYALKREITLADIARAQELAREHGLIK